MSRFLHSKLHAMGLLTLLLLALCPGRASAISGNLTVSQLGTQRVYLDGTTTITVDQDWYLREITGGDYDLKIILQNGAQLMVDQDRSRQAAIDAKSLDVRGNGTLYVTGLNIGVWLRGGDLKVTNCNATFVARHGKDWDIRYGVAIEGEINEFIINNANVSVSGQCVAIESVQTLKITGSNPVLNAWGGEHCVAYQAPQMAASGVQDFIMESGEVNLTSRDGEGLFVYNAQITGGKLTINQSGGTWDSDFGEFNAALKARWINATNCELNINSSQVAIYNEYADATFNNAKVNINVGASFSGIRVKNLTIDGNSDFTVNASHEAIVCRGDFSLKADKFYAKARSDGYHAVWVDGTLTIHMGAGTYEAYTTGKAPFAKYAGSQLNPLENAFIVDCPYTVNDIHDVSNLSIGETNVYKEDNIIHGAYVFKYNGLNITHGVKITCPDLRYYEETDQVHYSVNGCFDKGTYTAGQTIYFNVPDIITQFINKPVSNPDATLGIVWYRFSVDSQGNSTLEHINNDGRTFYAIEPADMNKTIYALFHFDTHDFPLETERVSVQKKANTVTPEKPALAFRANYVWVTNNDPSQEYLLLTTYKDVQSLTEADWANAESSTSSSFRLSGTTGQVNYVYTRWKETATQLPGSVVLYNSVYYGTTDQIKDIMLQFTDVTANTTIENGVNGFTTVPLNHVIKIEAVTVPSDIVGFQGVLGSSWLLDNRVTYYRDAACTQAIHDWEFGILDPDTYYKTFYVKYTKPTEALQSSTLESAHYVEMRYNNVYKRTQFIVSKEDGTYNLLWIYASNGYTPNGADYPALYVPAGTSFEIPMMHVPVNASTDDITFTLYSYSQDGVENTGTPPELSYYEDENGGLILVVNTTNTDVGFHAMYTAKQNERSITFNSPALFLYVTAPEPTGIAINPSEITLEPLFGEAQLEAVFTPANAKPKPITWSSDNSNVMVDETGKVTLSDDAIGETATITATAGDFTATCTVTVSGERYPIMVNGTQINSLIQDDVFMDGTVSYVGGTLTLNGATLSNLQSEVPNLTIDVQGTNTLSGSGEAVVYLAESSHIAGNGELTVTSSRSSGLAVALYGQKDITVEDTVKVEASNSTSSLGVGVMAMGRLSVNSPEAQLRGYGKYASVGYREGLVGTVIEPEGGKPVYDSNFSGYFIGDASGNIVKDAWVTIDGSSTIIENFTGTLWQEITSGGEQFSSSETNKTVKLTSDAETPELASVAFPDFTRAGTSNEISSFTIKDVEAYDYVNGFILYSLPEPTSMILRVGKQRMPVRNMMVKGAKDSAGNLCLKLTMKGAVNGVSFTLWFGPADMTLDQIKAAIDAAEEIITDVDGVESETKEAPTYDLSGRRIEKITQPGIYIKNGKKILVK